MMRRPWTDALSYSHSPPRPLPLFPFAPTLRRKAGHEGDRGAAEELEDPAAGRGGRALARGAAEALEGGWRKRSRRSYNVLREEGTERAGTSPLNDEKRAGVFVCAGCNLPLFTSDMKFESGTGWPSFFTTIPGVFETKTDYNLFFPRTEYHCIRCGGHHGHVSTTARRPRASAGATTAWR